jgi:hypothetical protein
MGRYQADATEQVSGVRGVNNRRVLKGIFWVSPFKCAMARSARKPLRVGRKIGFVLQKTR